MTRSIHRKGAVLLVALLLCVVSARVLAGELIVNGTFETGALSPAWQHGAYRGNNTNPNLADHGAFLDLPYSGNYSALLGFKYTAQRRNTYAWMSQQVSIPAGISIATLRFKVRMEGYDSAPYDPFRADIRDTSGNVLANVLNYSFTEWNNKFKDSGWLDDDTVLPIGYDMTAFAGTTVQVYFEQSNLFDNLYETWTYVDNVSLIYRMWVDLAAGGDGDDRFGAVGTGAGALAARSGVTGDTLFYPLTVENEGPTPDSYLLAATAPAGWQVLVNTAGSWVALPYTTPVIAAGGSTTYTVAVVTPAGAGVGVTDVIVDATGTGGPGRVDSATLRANLVDAAYEVDAVVDGNGTGIIGAGGAGGFALKQAPWDSTVTYTVDVFNAGNQSTAFRIDFAIPSGVTADVVYNSTMFTIPFVTASVAPGGSATMTLELRGPRPLPGGDYAAVVRAVAVNDTNRSDSIRAIMRLRAPRLDLVIAASGDGVYDATQSGLGGASSNAGEPGTVVNFPLIVQNESMLADSFTFQWVAPGPGWSAVLSIAGSDRAFPVTTPVFAGFASAVYILRITIPGGAAFGTYASILNAVSSIDPGVSESVTATVSVASASEMDATIDGDGTNVYGPIGTGLGGMSVRTVAPGDTARFAVLIENISGVDAFDISWSAPPGWSVTFGGSAVPLNGVPAGPFQLMVVVPPNSPGGTFDVIVDSHKSGKLFFMDSVTGRLVVVPPASVDALIDGNGDGVYGPIGSGSGGISTQSTPAPATVNFTVELQNEGPSADEYTVTWNAAAGATASLSGSPSPFTTPPIPSGGAGLYTFSVTLAAGMPVGPLRYTLDVASVSDSLSFESVTAELDIVGPPRADLVIDGNGLGVFGPMGTGLGGTSIHAAAPGSVYGATLRVYNAGSFADSLRVDWAPPAGWPGGSITLLDGSVVRGGAFWTAVIPPGGFAEFPVTVSVPAGVTGSFTARFNSWASLPPNWTDSADLVTETSAVVRGVVFHDLNHNGARDAGEPGMSGVRVFDTSSGASALTGADGAYTFTIVPAPAVRPAERNPAGYVSLSPDTLGPFIALAGDTLVADFADAPPVGITAGSVANGLAGVYVDFPHAITSRARGSVSLTSTSNAGAVVMFLLDADSNGVFSGTDRAIVPGDLSFDPVTGPTRVHILTRVFVPAGLPAGSTIRVEIDAVQSLAPSSAVTRAQAVDAVLVTGSALGRLTLAKAAGRTGALPGQSVRYTISFRNAGTDSLQNMEILDPISPWVDVEPDAFGAGRDVELVVGGAPPVYLTFAPLDGDECDYLAAERLLRLVFARNGPWRLAPGQAGVIRYRVRVR